MGYTAEAAKINECLRARCAGARHRGLDADEAWEEMGRRWSDGISFVDMQRYTVGVDLKVIGHEGKLRRFTGTDRGVFLGLVSVVLNDAWTLWRSGSERTNAWSGHVANSEDVQPTVRSRG